MAKQENAAIRNANKHFRMEEKAKEGTEACKQYIEQQDATRLKTARLRAQRLARDAADASTAVPIAKVPVRTNSATKR
jgi:hypothetical protein